MEDQQLHGQAVSDEQIQTWSDEAEAGYSLDDLGGLPEDLDNDRDRDAVQRILDPKNYTVHEDGSKVPTLDYIVECLQKLRDGDQEYIDSLVKVDWDKDSGTFKPVD